MGLNDIKFPLSLLAELYDTPIIPNEKINPPLIHAVPEKSPEPEYATKKNAVEIAPGTVGENKKNIVIAVRNQSNLDAADESFRFLTDILKACRLGLPDVLILNGSSEKPSFEELKKKFNPRFILLFGVSQDQVGIPMRFPEFQVTSYSGMQFLSAPPLENIREDKIVKGRLWNALRQLFNI